MIDCLAGYRLNPGLRGIAKLNMILPRHLGVPMTGVGADALADLERPLLSIVASDFTGDDAANLDRWAEAHADRFELFLHAFNGTAVEQRLLASAARVCVGNTELYRTLRPVRPD